MCVILRPTGILRQFCKSICNICTYFVTNRDANLQIAQYGKHSSNVQDVKVVIVINYKAEEMQGNLKYKAYTYLITTATMQC